MLKENNKINKVLSSVITRQWKKRNLHPYVSIPAVLCAVLVFLHPNVVDYPGTLSGHFELHLSWMFKEL